MLPLAHAERRGEPSLFPSACSIWTASTACFSPFRELPAARGSDRLLSRPVVLNRTGRYRPALGGAECRTTRPTVPFASIGLR